MSIYNISSTTNINIDFSNATLINNFIGNAINGYSISMLATKSPNNSIILSPNPRVTFQGITACHNGIINIILFINNVEFILICNNHRYNSGVDLFYISSVLNTSNGTMLTLNNNSEYITI